MKKYLFLSMFVAGFSAQAADVVSQKNIGLDLATDFAMLSTKKCQEDGYQVSTVVVDKHGNVRAALRDDLAAHFTLEIAQRKANMTIMSGIRSGDFKKAREDIRQELNHINGLIVMDGGVPVVVAGGVVGAIGVSGAPGGHLDAACADYAIKKLQERIDFADDD